MPRRSEPLELADDRLSRVRRRLRVVWLSVPLLLAAGVAVTVVSLLASGPLVRSLWLATVVLAVAVVAGAARLERAAVTAAATTVASALAEERLRLDAVAVALDARNGELTEESSRIAGERAEVVSGRAEVTRSIEEIARGLEEVARNREEIDRALAELARRGDELERRRREDEERRRIEAEERRQREEERHRQEEEEEEELRAVAPEPSSEPVHGPGGTPSLVGLERLVAECADATAEQREAWEIYLLSLRDVADVDGHLPASVDALVWEVFGELLGG